MSDKISLTETRVDPNTGLRTIYHYPDRNNRNAYYIKRELAPGGWSFGQHGITLTAAERAGRDALRERIRQALNGSDEAGD